MSTARRGMVVVAPVLAAILLASCAAPVAEAPPSVDSPAATQSPSYVQPAAPTSRLGLECADLMALPSLPAAVGGTPVEVPTRGDVRGGIIETISDLQSLAVAQAGGLQCAWAPTANDLGAVSLEVLPGGDAGWAGHAVREQLAVAEGWADAAYVGCYSLEGFHCQYDLLVGAVWVQLSVYSISVEPGPLGTVADPLARDLIAEIEGAGEPAPLWIAEASDLPATCAEQLPDGTVLDGVGAVMAVDAPYGEPLLSEARRLADATWCAWEGAQGGMIQSVLVPGAEWAWKSHPPASNESLTLAPVADGSITGCRDNDCVLHRIVRGGWLGLIAIGPEGLVLPALGSVADTIAG